MSDPVAWQRWNPEASYPLIYYLSPIDRKQCLLPTGWREIPLYRDDGPTEQEQCVVKALADAWNAFLTLPIEHDDDIPEFRRLIHAAQEKVLARTGRRWMNNNN